MSRKSLVHAAVLALMTMSLAGCVSGDPYYYDGYGDYYDGYDQYRGDYYRGPYYNYRRGDRWRDDRNRRRYPDRQSYPDRRSEKPAPPRVQPNYIPSGQAHRAHTTTSGRVPPPILPTRNYRR